MVSAQLLNDLRRDEGWSSAPYRDSQGLLTIGYGFLIDPNRQVTLPRAVGELWLQLEADGKWSALIARLPWLQSQPDDVKRALQNMAYNLGVEGVSAFKLMLGALERGDREAAALNALDSEWAKQVGARAVRVADLIRGHSAEGDD